MTALDSGFKTLGTSEFTEKKKKKEKCAALNLSNYCSFGTRGESWGEDRQIYGTCRMENKTARAEERQQDGRGGRRRLQDSDAGLLRDGVGVF